MPVIRPQPGPQELFLASPADIALYGGAAGGGKTWALLLEPLRHVTTNPEFYATFFRRTTVQIRNPGGLWDESMKMYGPIGAKPIQQTLEWGFGGGGRVKFAHLEHENTVFDWQGAQVPLICFDELTHFTASQFWYLLSRNRSMSGVRPYIRATCNPDADSWVGELIAWWIDQETGFPIRERAGVVRWFARINDTMYWADSPSELTAQHPGCQPKSLTFIPASLNDNQALMTRDPGYLANLMALPTVQRERLLGGNWKIRPSAGLYFQRRWCAVLEAAPAGLRTCRGWDLAATPKTETNDPDWTTGTKIGKTPDGRFVVMDHTFLRGGFDDVTRTIRNTASQDGTGTIISLPQDPGAAGKAVVAFLTKQLAGYRVEFSTESRASLDVADTLSKQAAKISRLAPFSAQAKAGNVDVLAGPWNERWFAMLEAFPESRHDDDVDSTSRAFGTLVAAPKPARMINIPFMGR